LAALAKIDAQLFGKKILPALTSKIQHIKDEIIL